MLRQLRDGLRDGETFSLQKHMDPELMAASRNFTVTSWSQTKGCVLHHVLRQTKRFPPRH